jgi:hypothetical protein
VSEFVIPLFLAFHDKKLLMGLVITDLSYASQLQYAIDN